MKCPWPALRAARVMRTADAIIIEADDPIASGELKALAEHQCWHFNALGEHRFALSRKLAPD